MALDDVFSDIVNVLIFDGEQVVVPDSLKDMIAVSQYRTDDGKMHEQERDVLKIWKNKNVNSVLIGIENQTRSDKNMPFRVIGYDGASYRSQLLKKRVVRKGGKKITVSSKRRFPIITMILYFGDTEWNGSKNLTNSFIPKLPQNKIAKKISKYVSNYRINVFDIGNLSEEDIEKFQSDFKLVAEYFVNVRCSNSDYVPSGKSIVHVDEFLKLMSVLTGDKRYAEYIDMYTEEEKRGGQVNMCKILDARESKGRTEGEQRVLELISRLVAEGKSNKIKLISSDEVLRNRLYVEYGL
ncbi:MAG: Rpn family recombination-promoting nuclease/putative transposase [Lachnospiraceae bacterium]|nr:Rpn family recombination-promoting nuclease/putative transposase [Lachnospiraceae bacterium]